MRARWFRKSSCTTPGSTAWKRLVWSSPSAPEIGLGLGEVERRRHRHPDPPPGDANTVLGGDPGTVGDGDERRFREPQLHPGDPGKAQDVLEAAERLVGERMAELLSLAEDGELLPALDAVLLGEVQVHAITVHAHPQPLDRRKRVHYLLDEEPEGGTDLIGQRRLAGPGNQQQHHRHEHRAEGGPPTGGERGPFRGPRWQ